MVDFRGISPARQPQAIPTVPDTLPKTHCSFSVFISAPFTHEFHSLTQSEQHTVGNDTYYIIHSSIEFHFLSSFFLKKKQQKTHTPAAHTLALHHTDKVQKYTRLLLLRELRSQTYNKSNTHANMLWSKILKNVTATWSNAHMIPKGATLNKLLPAGERGGWEGVEAAGFEQKEEVYMMSAPRGDGAGDGTEQEGVKSGSLQPFITLEGDRELRGAEW